MGLINSVKKHLSGSKKGKIERSASGFADQTTLPTTPSVAPPPYTPDPVVHGKLVIPTHSTRQRDVSPTPSCASQINVDGDNNDFAFLKTFDTVFVIDDSGSMTLCSELGGVSRWKQVQTLLQRITPICTKHDSDGIDVYFLNKSSKQPALEDEGKPEGGYRNISSPAEVIELFDSVSPYGGTPLDQTLDTILYSYTTHYAEKARAAKPKRPNVKPVNIIVITDGMPTDPIGCVNVIVHQAKKLDEVEAPAHQVGVQFFQIGDDDGARKFLQGLDDNIREENDGRPIRDMVDTTTFDARYSQLTAHGVLKAVGGAVNRTLDREKTKNVGEWDSGGGRRGF